MGNMATTAEVLPDDTDGGFQILMDLYEGMKEHEWNKVESILNERSDDSPLLPNRCLPVLVGNTILHIAAMTSAPLLVMRKLMSCVDVEYCSQPNECGFTPLYLTCFWGEDMAAVRLLALDRPQDFHAMNQHDQSPCDVLMERNRGALVNDVPLPEEDIAGLIAQVTEALRERATNTAEGQRHAVNSKGETLLHRAVEWTFGDFPLIRMLLHEMPELLVTKDSTGQTVLHHAARQEDAHAATRLQFLLDRSYPLVCVQDDKGQTPLHAAVTCTNSPVKQQLVEILVRIYPIAIVLRDHNGKTPLQAFCEVHSHLIGNNHYTDQHPALADIAMTLLTGIPLRSSRDNPSLHILLRSPNCSLPVANLLVRALRSQLSRKDYDGNLPLHIVCSFKPTESQLEPYEDVIRSLLDLHPDACKVPNRANQLPMELMVRSRQMPNDGLRMVIFEHPAAVLDFGMNRLDVESNRLAMCNMLLFFCLDDTPDALFRLLRDGPELVRELGRLEWP